MDRTLYAIVPLDEDLIDYFVESNPTFRAECEAIRGRMKSGQSVSLDAVRERMAGK